MFSEVPSLSGTNEDVVILKDYIIALRRELDDALYNLDSENIRELNASIIRTAIKGARIELQHNGITSYNDLNQLHGLYCDPSAPYANLRLYYNGITYFEVERMADASGLLLSAFGKNILGFNDATLLTTPFGEWDFSYCTGVYGLLEKGYATLQHVADGINNVKAWVEANYQPIV